MDASLPGLGAALIQEGQPIAYANSEALTPTQQNYAQIKKELLAMVFSCAKFEEYIVGRAVTIETDHKPLESIIKKPFHASPNVALTKDVGSTPTLSRNQPGLQAGYKSQFSGCSVPSSFGGAADKC